MDNAVHALAESAYVVVGGAVAGKVAGAVDVPCGPQASAAAHMPAPPGIGPPFIWL